MGYLRITSVAFLVLPLAILAQSSSDVNITCSSNNNHLDPSSHRFVSDCDDKTYCTAPANGTCQPRLCRHDEFPFGFIPGEAIPPLCPSGSFCPDEGSGCLPFLTVGSACQLNRDDQCAPPKNWNALSNHQNFNGSLCLHSSCVFANVTLGQTCIADQTTYIDVAPDGEGFNFTVTRHNCRTPSLFCDPSLLQCVPTKAIGADCTSDQDCQTLNCESGICAEPPEMPTKVAKWQWIVTIATVVCAMLITVVILTLIHKRIRMRHYDEIHEYYEEQLSLRRHMFALHAAASERNGPANDEKSSLKI